MEAEKVRVYVLARELGVEAKDLVDLCKRFGIDIKNQLSSVDLEQAARIRGTVCNSPSLRSVQTAVGPHELTPPLLSQQSLVLPSHPLPGLTRQFTEAAPPSVISGTVAVGGPSVLASVPELPITSHRAANLPPRLRPQSHYEPKKNSGVEHLLSTGEEAGLEKLDRISLVAEIDTECAVFKIRQITERLCRKVISAKGRRTLDEMIVMIERQNLLGKKAVAYLRQIQNLGNQAAHNTDDLFEEEFTLGDVNNASEALACVLEAALKHKRLGSG